MKSHLVIMSALALSLLITLAGASSAEPASPSAHLVTAAGARLFDAEPMELPSAAHPEGTVVAIASEREGTPNVVEVDVHSNTVLHRSTVVCSRILRDGARVFALCGEDLDELDRNLVLAARTETRGCRGVSEARGGPDQHGSRPLRLFYDGSSRLVVALSCDAGLRVAVLDVRSHELLGTVDTKLYAEGKFRSDVSISFHRNTIGGLVVFGLGPARSFTLSGDYRRLAHVGGAGPSDEAPLPARAPSPAGLGGDFVDYELALGDVRLLLTRSCCGGSGGNPPGLYAARTP